MRRWAVRCRDCPLSTSRGVLPDPTPVVTEHTDETETEKEARLAVDQANLSRLGAVLQLHAG